jgi:regulator of protease activity HflC (stomatin/prohibitin superfamily)
VLRCFAAAPQHLTPTDRPTPRRARSKNVQNDMEQQLLPKAGGRGHPANHAGAGAPDLEQALARCILPENLKQRLREDERDPLYTRIASVTALHARAPNSSYGGTMCACLCGKTATLVEQGRIGVLKHDADYYLLAPGYHSFPSCGTDNRGDCDLTLVNSPVTYGAAGFVTITEGRIGVLQTGAAFRLLPPGTYQWDSPSVKFAASVDIATEEADLGPYKLVTVPEGEVAVTYNNGSLHVLGAATEARDPCRAYFLDDPKWTHCGNLSLQTQTDRLESNDLLSKDNVELVMVAMSQWRIVDPVLAVTHCAVSMKNIRVKVNQLVRATIARIVAGTCIGAGPVSGAANRPVVAAVAVSDDAPPQKARVDEEPGLARLMQSDAATGHMAEMNASMQEMGVEVVSVYVPEKRMKNDDIRQQIAKQAVIGIKADAERSAADAAAYAKVKASGAEAESIQLLADAAAYAKVKDAVAEAESIALLATAHTEAGAQLGEPTSTAARLALTETTSSALKGAKMTIFAGAPSQMPFMLNGVQ